MSFKKTVLRTPLCAHDILNDDDNLSRIEISHARRRPSRVRSREEEGYVRKVNGV